MPDRIGVKEFMVLAAKEWSAEEMEVLCRYCETIDGLPADKLLEQIQAEFDGPAQQLIAEGLSSGELDRDSIILIMADVAMNKSSIS